MASNTENLNLLMKNPSTDGADTFNVQTMLNENWQKIDNNAGTVAQTLANILKPTTPPIIGLPPSTTPDGMFQALGNTGELHVWRKTVKNAEDIPAGYTLGEVQNVTKYPITDVRSGGYTIVTKAYSNLSVDDAGNVSLDESSYVNFYDDASAVRGKFIRVDSDGDILFIPNDANISTDYKTVGSAVIHNHYTDKYQIVTGYPITPAGTTTTYPVSTNPNAYQEGDDAKKAGYTLGDVVSGSFKMGERNVSYPYLYNVSSALAVSEDGTISIDSATSNNVRIGFGYSLTVNTLQTAIAGKFVQYVEQSGVSSTMSAPDTVPPFNTRGVIVFIPSDAKVTQSDAQYIVSKYQPVTGYAAIPAGTTIEYLGRLGDKARVQVVSYVGTGTYGESNPCRLTFDFPPKVVMFLRGYKKGSTQFGNLTASHSDDNKIVTPESLVTTYTRYNGFGGPFGSYAKKSEDGKTIFWYNEQSSTQGNDTGYTYYFLAIG